MQSSSASLRRYPRLPVVGVGGIVLCGELVLLVRRGKNPGKGLWSLPGGAVEVGEGLEEACAREVAEETGISCRVGPLVEVVERILCDEAGRVEYHYVLMDYLCWAEMTQPTAGDDAADARWVRLGDMGQAGLTSDTLRVIQKAAKMAPNNPA